MIVWNVECGMWILELLLLSLGVHLPNFKQYVLGILYVIWILGVRLRTREIYYMFHVWLCNHTRQVCVYILQYNIYLPIHIILLFKVFEYRIF